MQKFLLFLVLIPNFIYSQEGIHIQWHRQSMMSAFNIHNNDSVYHVARIANTSTNNVIAVINLKNESWNYIVPSTTINLNNFTLPIFMKNSTHGCTGAVYTTDNWQTITTNTSLPAGLTVKGSTPYGYYGYNQVAGSPITYQTRFSPDGITWDIVHTDTYTPQFVKTKDKLYTIHNDLLNASTNGGASYTPVNTTYTLNGLLSIPNNDTMFVMSSQIFRSFDGGSTWNSVAYPNASWSQVATKNGKEMLFFNNNVTPKVTYFSNNSGTSFTTNTFTPIYNNDVLIANENAFYLYPSYKTKDGINWDDFLPSAPAPKPYDVTHTANVVLTAFAQGYFGFSLNKGFNFNFINNNKVSTNFDLMAVKAIDEQNFLAADRKGQIFVSTNQGQTWSQKNSSTTNAIPKKFVVSNNTQVIVLAGSVPLKSYDGGTTFTPLYTFGNTSAGHTMKPSTGNIINVTPVYSAPSFTHTGYEFYQFDLSGNKTLISTIPVTVAENVLDMVMADDNIGYMAATVPTQSATVIYKTTNGWLTTNTVASIPTPTVGVPLYTDARLQVFGTDTIILSGSGGNSGNQTTFFHQSTNGGITWNKINTNFSVPTTILGDKVYRMSFYNPSEYMALISNGFAGSIQASVGVYIKTNAIGNPNVIGVNEYLKGSENTEFKVYPNPANDVLNFDIVNTTFENNINQVIITNSIGQIMLQQKIKFTSNTQLNINSLPTGIYFMTLINNKNKLITKFIKE